MSDRSLDPRFLELEGEGGGKVHFLRDDGSIYFNKITVLYGETGTGKSVLIRNILYILSEKKPLVVVISPTARSNGIYDGIVDQRLIHRNPTEDLLNKIYSRQEQVSELHLIANKIENLKMVFDICNDPRAKSAESIIITKSQESFNSTRSIRDPVAREKEMKEITKLKTNSLTKLYNDTIEQYSAKLLTLQNLPPQQQGIINTVVKCRHLNPNLILILDDCAAEFKKLNKTEVIRKMFYQGRNNHMTTIISFQAPTDLDNNLRRNAHNSFFTTAICAAAYFNIGTNGQSKAMKQRCEQVVRKVFYDPQYAEFHKMAYLREKPDPFRVVLAAEHNEFNIYEPVIKNFLSKIQIKQKKIYGMV